MKKSSTRRIALNVLMDVTDRGKYAGLALKDALFGMESSDAAFISALVYETLSSLKYVDFIISSFARGSVKPVIRAILRLGVCQFVLMNAPAHVVCSESVKLTEEVGKAALKGYVNGVMRNICASDLEKLPLPNDTISRLSIRYSYPEFLVREYIELYGEEFTKDMLAYDGIGMTIRAQSPYTTEELTALLDERGIYYTQGKLVPDAIKLKRGFDPMRDERFINGQLTVQSESAMLVCKLCGTHPGMLVLDACAAPGGKTAYLSMLMGNTGHIDALELYEHRVKLIENTLSRLHVANVSVMSGDASVFDPEKCDKYDVVLVDAPCSGFGVTHKMDARYKKTSEDIDELCKIQFDILSNCGRYVKPGGALIYSTCTISRRENEHVAELFLKTHDGFYVDMPDEFANNGSIGMQLFPHVHDTDGFYMVRFKRASDIL
ncbi:MAG: 16S rRNA (cytosine(967)-C(5))-methyltransferase RsmB [Clostridia bacterium]|nr:16S rRNA (cytosine(967)-C(5))-methyltransferase RsmB [Clostridia bacterium]